MEIEPSRLIPQKHAANLELMILPEATHTNL